MACPSCKGEFNLVDTVFVEDEVIPVVIIPEVLEEELDNEAETV
jgi:uncharacterized protein YbaR (Trm112 family)